MAVAPDARAVAQRPIDRLAQADPHVLGRVMPVDVQVAGAGDRQVHQRMAGEQLEHVVEKTDARRDLGPPLAVQVEPQSDVGLASRAHDLGDASGALKVVGPEELRGDQADPAGTTIGTDKPGRAIDAADCNRNLPLPLSPSGLAFSRSRSISASVPTLIRSPSGYPG